MTKIEWTNPPGRSGETWNPNSMSDLFHEDVSDDAVWRVFDVMRVEPSICKIRNLKHPKRGDPGEWPDDLRVREWPNMETPS